MFGTLRNTTIILRCWLCVHFLLLCYYFLLFVCVFIKTTTKLFGILVSLWTFLFSHAPTISDFKLKTAEKSRQKTRSKFCSMYVIRKLMNLFTQYEQYSKSRNWKITFLGKRKTCTRKLKKKKRKQSFAKNSRKQSIQRLKKHSRNNSTCTLQTLNHFTMMRRIYNRNKELKEMKFDLCFVTIHFNKFNELNSNSFLGLLKRN